MKVLLVEDDPMLLDIYSTKFKEAGFEVITAGDGEEALRKAEKEQPDVMILDLVLPHQDGWEVLEALKKNKKHAFKVVVLSNVGQKEDVERGLQLGAVKYLIKSQYTPSQVVEEVKNVAS